MSLLVGSKQMNKPTFLDVHAFEHQQTSNLVFGFGFSQCVHIVERCLADEPVLPNIASYLQGIAP